MWKVYWYGYYLKSNHLHCNLTSLEGRKNTDRGRSRQNTFGATPFQPMENALCDIKRALQKGHVRSFAEKSRDSDPKDPLVARLKMYFCILNLIYCF